MWGFCRSATVMGMWWFLLLACGPPAVSPADADSIRAALVVDLAAGPLALTSGEPHTEAGATVRPVSFKLQPGFSISGALWVPDAPLGTGVLVAHGHYGQGKSSAEAQEIAHRLAARGHIVLAVDTPGVEEWDVPGRRIHFDAGAHNRAFLVAGGSSAVALQLAVLRRGLDLLESQGARRLAATGASGGAVQAFLLQLIDPRVVVSALASPPRVPREARASGCACDQIPGWPGPDPSLLAALDGPSIWMSEVRQDRPAGLPSQARFEIFEGPHSYTEPMQRRAIDFMESELGGGHDVVLRSVPQVGLSAPRPDSGSAPITELSLPVGSLWHPAPRRAVAHTQVCAGEGPTVVVAAGEAQDIVALHTAGFRTCSVQLITASGQSWDPVDLAESVTSGAPLIDRVAGALLTVAQREDAVAIWGNRAFGLAASGVGLPFVVRDPVRTVDQVDPATDPPWIHVPGAWWGAVEAQLAGALAVGPDPAELARALDPLR